jgi:hypothetical protein
MENDSLKELQEGIIISPEKSISDSLAQVMKLELHSTAESVHEFLHDLWIVFKELRSSEFSELMADTRLDKYADWRALKLAFASGIFDFIFLNRYQNNVRLLRKLITSFPWRFNILVDSFIHFKCICRHHYYIPDYYSDLPKRYGR